MIEIAQEPCPARCDDSTPRDRRNLLRVAVAVALWMLCLAIAARAGRDAWLPPGIWAWALAALPLLPGAVALVTYARYLQEADELQRAVQVQALAVAFGVAVLALAGYPLFERLGAPPAKSAHYLGFLGIVYGVANWLAWRRYR